MPKKLISHRGSSDNIQCYCTYTNMATLPNRIITGDGLVAIAEEEDIYSVISGFDGHDYMVVFEGGVKLFKQFIDDSVDDFDAKEMLQDTPITEEEYKEQFPEEVIQTIKKKKMIKPPPKPVTPTVEEPPKDSQPVKKLIMKKLIKPMVKDEIVKKEPQENPKDNKDNKDNQDKKLSPYHSFIKEFLKNNSDIPWNERMKAANAAWKASKESKA
jgi:hypothetical protein